MIAVPLTGSHIPVDMLCTYSWLLHGQFHSARLCKHLPYKSNCRHSTWVQGNRPKAGATSKCVATAWPYIQAMGGLTSYLQWQAAKPSIEKLANQCCSHT